MLLFYPLGAVGIWQIVIIVLAVLILFGANKIPEFMKGLGKGVKSFKEGMNEVEKEITETHPETKKEESADKQ